MVQSMRQFLVKMIQVMVSALIVCSLILPAASSISYCHPMEEIMLVKCCDEVQEDHGLAFVNPDCCDEIKFPVAKKDTSKTPSLPALKVSQKGYATPERNWIVVTDIFKENTVPVGARGPPLNGPSLYISNCSYLI
jgi:hypothetical protein